MAVDSGHADVGFLGDLLHGGRHQPFLGKQGAGGLQNAAGCVWLVQLVQTVFIGQPFEDGFFTA